MWPHKKNPSGDDLSLYIKRDFIAIFQLVSSDLPDVSIVSPNSGRRVGPTKVPFWKKPNQNYLPWRHNGRLNGYGRSIIAGATTVKFPSSKRVVCFSHEYVSGKTDLDVLIAAFLLMTCNLTCLCLDYCGTRFAACWRLGYI